MSTCSGRAGHQSIRKDIAGTSVETVLSFCLSKDAAEFQAKVLEALGRVGR